MSVLSVVIVTWNGRHHLETCLPALRAQTFKNFTVIMVDNGSTDGTVEFVRDHFPEVQIISLPRNGGFAAPNNLGIRSALSDPAIDYVVTLNNDTKPEPEYLAELVACAERHPQAGSIQPKVINFFEPLVIDSTGMLIARDMSAVNRGLKEQDHGQFACEEEIFGAAASASLYHRTALERVALVDRAGRLEFFDDDYFAYYEDVDLAWRMRLAGFSCFYAPAARVFHVHSATGRSYSPFKAFHIHRNQYYNIIKNLPLLLMLRALVLMPKLYVLSLMSILHNRGPTAKLRKQASSSGDGLVMIVLRSWCQVFYALPVLLCKRRQVKKMRVVSVNEIESWFKRFAVDFKKVVYG